MAAEKKSILLYCNNSSSSNERLFSAIKDRKNVSTIEAILQESVDIDARDSEGYTPLLLSAQLMRKDVCKLLIKYGANVDCCDLRGTTLLHFASLNGWCDMVQSLVKKGIDVNARDTGIGWSALHYAVCHSNPLVLKYLVEQKVDIDVRTCDCTTPSLCSSKNRKRDDSDVHAGENVDIRVSFEDKMLHFVAQSGWLKVVQSLVKRDLDIADKFGQTPLLLACRQENLFAAEYLFQAGASCEAVQCDGKSTLHYLIEMEKHCDINKVHLIKLFMENIGDLLPADYEGMFNKPQLKSYILQDVTFCCRIIVSKFNKRDLPELYKLPAAVSLPRVEEMKIVNCSEVFRVIEQTVHFEVQTKGHCNPFKVRQMTLKVLCVKSVLKCFAKI